MNLKEEYKNINFADKMIKRIELWQEDDEKKEEIIKEYNKQLNKVISKNWLDTYKVLSILFEEVIDIKYTILQIQSEIFDENFLCFVWLILDDKGEKTSKFLRYETKKEFQERVNNSDLQELYRNKAVIEIETKDKSKVEDKLNSIASDWNDSIYIKYI